MSRRNNFCYFDYFIIEKCTKLLIESNQSSFKIFFIMNFRLQLKIRIFTLNGALNARIVTAARFSEFFTVKVRACL